MPQAMKPSAAAPKNKKDRPKRKKKGEVAPERTEPVRGGDQPDAGPEPWMPAGDGAQSGAS